jgi:hypothetical protein
MAPNPPKAPSTWRPVRSSHERAAIGRAIAWPIGIVFYGLAAYFGLLGWAFLVTVVYFIFAFMVLPVALRGVGMTNHGRINLVAQLLSIIPAVAVLWPPLHSAGFHPHGSWTNVACLLVSAGSNCR